MSEVINMKVSDWRRKAREGTLSIPDMKLALAAIRAERVGAGATSEKSTTKRTAAAKKAAPIDSDKLLEGLM